MVDLGRMSTAISVSLYHTSNAYITTKIIRIQEAV